MQPTVTPIDATLGAVVTDVDLNELDEASWRVIEYAFHEYAALAFPAQHLSEEAQVAFGLRFGGIEYLRENAQSVQISNKNSDGTVLEPDAFRCKALRGNEG